LGGRKDNQQHAGKSRARGVQGSSRPEIFVTEKPIPDNQPIKPNCTNEVPLSE